ncbi:MAG: hypothetical protein JO139_07340 [Alphaproteobacteria bacterium]|nr:hypothetical protein [Alphaproteobacteria bacterium]
MRGSVSILMFGLLAACADSSLPALTGDQIQAGFPPGGVVDVIQINAINRLPLRTAELIAPDGQPTTASYLTVNPSPMSPLTSSSQTGLIRKVILASTA